MTKLFETKTLVGYDKLQARVNELKELGWFIVDGFEDDIEFTDEFNAWVIQMKRSIYQKANHELPESPFTSLLINITKEQWEKALKEYKSSEWRTKPTFVTAAEKEPVVFSWDIPQKEGNEDLVSTLKDVYKRLGGGYDFLRQASQEQADFEQLLNSVLSISNLDRDKFLEDFEKWYTNSGTAESRLYALEVVYRSLVMGNRLPWEEK